jgi:hypothetical protein
MSWEIPTLDEISKEKWFASRSCPLPLDADETDVHIRPNMTMPSPRSWDLAAVDLRKNAGERVFDKSNRTDGTFSRADFVFDAESDRYTVHPNLFAHRE